MHRALRQSPRNRFPQQGQAFARDGRNPYGPPLTVPVPGHAWLAIQPVDLVVDEEEGAFREVEVRENLPDHLFVLLAIRVGGIHHVEEDEQLLMVTEGGMMIRMNQGMPATKAAGETVGKTVWALLGGTVIGILAFAGLKALSKGLGWG